MLDIGILYGYNYSCPRATGTHLMSAEVAELADAQDLKSCDPFRSYRFDSDLRHHLIINYRGVEQYGSSLGS